MQATQTLGATFNRDVIVNTITGAVRFGDAGTLVNGEVAAPFVVRSLIYDNS